MKKHHKKKLYRHRQKSHTVHHPADTPDSYTKAKNAFISNVSHEIRTPMNAIMGFAQMLKSTKLDTKQADYVDVILESGNKLLAMIGNLLDLSNLQMKKTHLHPVECNLNTFFETIWNHYRPQIVHKNLKPVLQVQENLPMARLDSEKLERVLSFILSNAIKFTVSGSVVLRVDLIRRPNEEPWLDIEVEDTGCGIEQERLKTIFDAFEQADNSITRAYPGMGLGLGISSKILELLGGEISAISQVGVGSSFHLKVPVDVF